MIFAISVGSSGEGEERYLLYIPFSVSPGREILDIDLTQKFKIGEYEIGFEKPEGYYALTVGPFPTEEQAAQYYPKIKSALLWVSLKYMIGLSSPAKLTDITLLYTPNPMHDIAQYACWDATDGYYDADKCVIRPEHKRLVRWETGRATVIAGLGAKNLVESVKEATSFPNPEKIHNDSKLQLAIELYSSYFFEQSTEAKFIKLVTVLEALTPDYNVSKLSESVINDAKKTIKSRRNEYIRDSEEWEELNELLCRLGKLKHESIGSSLRTYISNLIEGHPLLGDKAEVIDKLKDIYNHRSKLLHKGSTDKEAIKEGLQFLAGFIPKLLELLYRMESANSENKI